MTAFERLSPAMQYQIVNALGFQSLRPVQEVAIPPILDGANCVVLAPTAGGKTEAAFFPLLSQMDTHGWQPVSVLYVSPIRALLNNQEERLRSYATVLGRRVAVWHGDVSQRDKRKFLQEPADILLTTPESLEVMLMSSKVPSRRLFAGLQAVVIDEVHAFAGDDRGSHLMAVLERLCRFCGRDVQRIGLSATVGNPEEILTWLQGSSTRPGVLVSPPRPPSTPEIVIDYVGTLENAARVIAQMHRGKKRLVFLDSRAGVESLGQHLRDLGVDTYVLHSSLAPDERRRSEAAFAERQNCVIVATSSLELGIDIGDLDHVLQIDAPRTVASFLQRMGRTGRRAGATSNCTFLATDDDALLQAAALLRLYRNGFVESVVPVTRAFHILAHQLLALGQQEQGIPLADWWAWVGQAAPFKDITADERTALLAHMMAEQILVEDGGRLSLGPQGEKLYGGKNFLPLYSVFDTADSLDVCYGQRIIGNIESTYVEQQGAGDLTFTLGARAWRGLYVDWQRHRLYVEPATHANAPSWRGSPAFLSSELCGAMRDVLRDEGPAPEWSKRAESQMDAVRKTRLHQADADGQLLPETDGLSLWTFAGGRANHVVAKVLQELIGEKVTADNLRIRFRSGAADVEKIQGAMQVLAEEHRPNREDALRVVVKIAKAKLSKFQPCLPPEQEAEVLVGRLVDLGVVGDLVRRLAAG